MRKTMILDQIEELSTRRQPATSNRSSASFARQAVTKRRKSSDQSPDGARRGASFWPMWYRALIMLTLNSGGFLSAVHNAYRLTKQIVWPHIENNSPVNFSSLYLSLYFSSFLDSSPHHRGYLARLWANNKYLQFLTDQKYQSFVSSHSPTVKPRS